MWSTVKRTYCHTSDTWQYSQKEPALSRILCRTASGIFRRGIDLRRFTAVEITDDPVQETQKIVYFFISIQFFRFYLRQA